MQSKKSAFTLAEVLITLAVIGIVAAMTIPTVFQKNSEDEYRTALKKAVSSLSGAAYNNYAQTGIDFSKIEKGNSSATAGAPSLQSIIENRMVVTSKSTSATTWDSSISVDTCYTVTNTLIIGFNASSIGDCSSLGACTVYVDVNGIKAPNKLSTATAKNTGVMADQFKLYLYGKFAAPADAPAKYAMYRD